MKISKIPIILGLIMTLGVTNTSIVPRKLGGGGESDNPTEKLISDLKTFFDAKLKPLKPKVTEEQDGVIIYNMPERESKVTIQASGTQINVNLVNKYESQELQLENIEFEDEKELIEKNYVDKFIGHVSQVQSNLESIFKSVQNGLASASFKGLFGETSFNQIKPAKSKNKDSFLFELHYMNERLVMANDPIYGEINRVGADHTLRIVTKFFQKTFELAVVTDSYLTTEAKKLGDRVLSHLDSMYFLNEDPNDVDMEKYFSFDEEYKKHLKALLEDYLGKGFTVDEEITVKFGENVVATTSQDMTDGNGLMFTVIKANLQILSDQEFSLVLPDSSIYNVGALVDKFFLELMDYVKHSTKKLNEEDSVGVFE
jgi:hypothetical protein